MLEEHGLATVRAEERMMWRSSRAGRCSSLVRRRDHGVSRGRQALSESRQGTTFLRTGLGVTIAKGHAVIFQLEEAVVAQGDAENVGRQVLQSIETRAHACCQTLEGMMA
jgi:hypothetical protein